MDPSPGGPGGDDLPALSNAPTASADLAQSDPGLGRRLGDSKVCERNANPRHSPIFPDLR